jgi:hypothetical protein
LFSIAIQENQIREEDLNGAEPKPVLQNFFFNSVLVTICLSWPVQ